MGKFQNSPVPRRAFALVICLAMLALMMVLVTGLIMTSRAERRATETLMRVSRADNLAQIATNLVLGQLRRGTVSPAGTVESWASQPGAIRRYQAAEGFTSGYRLYSSPTMVFRGSEEDFSLDAPPSDWQDRPAEYCDLNAPVLRRVSTSGGAVTQAHFPILDPRARVDGFSYGDELPGGGRLGGVEFVTDPSAPDARLPMPVSWLYVLADGSLGWLNDQQEFQLLSGEEVSASNPITGRIAFWTDDESCKINLNTASEPTYWATPSWTHETDFQWAAFAPATGEYQRFPGHPAMNALSPVLAPGVEMTALSRRFLYRDLLPRVYDIGSWAGTRSYDAIRDDTGYLANLEGQKPERLYASADEFLFRPQPVAGKREVARVSEGGLGYEVEQEGGGGVLSAEKTARLPFFLTTFSRSDESTVFGTPRVSVWPVDVRETGGYRTLFDELIMRCATLGAKTNFYNFVRQEDDNPTHDISLARNRQLLGYLDAMLSRPVPGWSGAGGATFASKYGGGEHRQILVQIFDYIRATNMLDLRLEPNPLPAAANSFPAIYNSVPQTKKTFTEGRTRNANALLDVHRFPGFGQVAPSYHEAWNAMGFGRHATIDEITALFICCADGSVAASNIPPGTAGMDAQGNRAIGSALSSSEKVVQMTFPIEWFTPSMGFPIHRPSVKVVFRGLSQFQLDGKPLFPSDTAEIWSNWAPGDSTHSGRRGGSDNDIRGWLNDRRLPARRGLHGANQPADPNYGVNKRQNWDLVSDYIKTGNSTMSFSSTGPLALEIHTVEEDNNTSHLVQTILVRFPSTVVLPVPVIHTSARNWSFHWAGYNGNSTNTNGRFRNVGWNSNHDEWARFVAPELGDVAFSMIPWHGDYRITAASRIVGQDNRSPYQEGGVGWAFAPHPQAPGTFLQMVPAYAGEPARPVRGAVNYNDGDNNRIPNSALLQRRRWLIAPSPWFSSDAPTVSAIDHGEIGNDRRPDFPDRREAALMAWRYSDYAGTMGRSQEGALINMPDPGNFYANWTGSGTPPNYFGEAGGDARFFVEGNGNYFSPNRMIPSAGMLGSLPSGLKDQDPWRTLLFRPYIPNPWPTAVARHPGQEDPPDHLIMDLFWMPVVEPYVVSEPFSTAGKINLNHRLLPFPHVQRQTGLYSLLKEERVSALPGPDVDVSDSWLAGNDFVNGANANEAAGNRWHRKVDIPETLRGFDDYFDTGSLFRTASQICEQHIVPEVDAAGRIFRLGQAADSPGFANKSNPIDTRMKEFWARHTGTTDDIKERPYTNLISRLTTKSNTFTVHYRVQVLQRARSSEPGRFDPAKDTVVSEQRGSWLVERYVDPNESGLPDYAAEISTRPDALRDLPKLDAFSRFRVVSQRRFNP